VEIGVEGLFGLVETCGAFLRSYFDIILIISNGCPVFYLFYELFGLNDFTGEFYAYFTCI
jgi:hypothetical protein